MGLLSPELDLASQLQPILRLFGGGKYCVRIIHKVIFSVLHGITGEKTDSYYPYGFDDYYGEQLYLTDKFPTYLDETPEISGMDPERVKFYEDRIRKGFRPLCLVVADCPYEPPKFKKPRNYVVDDGIGDEIFDEPSKISREQDDEIFDGSPKISGELDEEEIFDGPLTCSWLLDGHHKLLAYYNLSILPSVLRIEYMGRDGSPGLDGHMKILKKLENNLSEDACYVMERYGTELECSYNEDTLRKWQDYELKEEDEKKIARMENKNLVSSWFRSKEICTRYSVRSRNM